MADIIDLDLRRNDKPLLDAVDPCTKCREVSFCNTTCDLAEAWWDQFVKKFNIQTGGE
jgi:hypothetical protein